MFSRVHTLFNIFASNAQCSFYWRVQPKYVFDAIGAVGGHCHWFNSQAR